MAAKQFMLPANRAFNSNGLAISGAQAKLYLSGTLVPANFYADSGLVTSLGATLTADGAGRFSTAYGDETVGYRLRVLDSDGAVLNDIDPYFFGLITGVDGANASIAVGTTTTGAAGSSAAVANSGTGTNAILDFTIPTGAQGPAGDVAKVATRTALAAITGLVGGETRALTESGREGLFVFVSSNLSANVTNDPNQGVYVAPASDTTGASGAWRRVVAGPINVKWFGAKGDGTTDDTAAIQAAINYAHTTGGALYFPAGIYNHTGLTFKNNVRYIGDGKDATGVLGTVLLYTGTSDGVQVNNPINSSTPANITVEGITFKNTARTAGKACFADTGSAYLNIRNCAFIGADRQLILDQSELTDVTDCQFEATAAGATCCVWIVNGADRNLGASAGFTNRISIQRCQIDGISTAYGIVDDGGNVHAFTDNNYNGCLNHIRATGVTGLKIDGGEFESASGPNIKFDSTSLAGAGIGACGEVYIGGGAQIVPSAGQNCIIAFSLSSIVLNDVFLGNSTAFKFNGTGNTNSIYAINAFNGGGGATFDGRATNHWEVGYDGTAFAVRTNLAYSWGGTTIINGSGSLQAAGFPALTGNVTTAAGSLATTIAANVVTYAKFQQVAASSLVGNPTGALANAQGVTLAGGLTFTGTTLTVGALTPTSVVSTGALTSSSATAGVGYSAGRGTVTQLTSKATGATSNTAVTDITMNAAALAASTTVSFVFTNSAIAANDTLILNHVSGGTPGSYTLNAHGFAAGSCTIDVRNVSLGSLSEAIVVRAVLVKGG